MNQRSTIFLLLSLTAMPSCGPADSSEPGDEHAPDGARVFSFENDASCRALGLPAAESITVTAGPLRSSVPRAIAPGAHGVWFTDAQNLTLSHLSPDGTLERFRAPFPSETVFDVAVGADGSVFFDIMTGDFVEHVGRITPDGEVRLTEIPSGQAARRLAPGPDGSIWFTSGEGVGVVMEDDTIREVPVGTRTGDLTISADGTVWFTEPDANRIGRLHPDGELTHFDVPTPASGLGSIALGPDGNVWFAATEAGKIGRITPEGAIHELDAVVAPARLGELTGGPDGRLWFTLSTGDYQVTRVGVLSVCGDVAFVDLPKISNSIDLSPALDVPAVPYGIAASGHELWITARLEPFETGVVLKLDLGDVAH